ncbi:DivIVA domain-containing protein [Umezawaea sp. NPDC059074]|uniref:DivIVA domain-containing protein n=1 Tax=Umezawaea sp. NPDC059074 TaxID=3346716 RepID=UPI003673C454
MSVHSVEDLVPLRTGFDLSWRGYHREEVDDYVHDLEHDLRDLAADRDACTARAEHLSEMLDRSRAETKTLRDELNRVCSTPFDIEVLPFRLAVMVEVATAEAASVLERAQAGWAAAQASAAKLRGHYDRLAEDTRRQRDEIDAERELVLRDARAQARTIIAEAEKRQRELDADAQSAREQVEIDFKLAMDQRRAEALRALARGELT